MVRRPEMLLALVAALLCARLAPAQILFEQDFEAYSPEPYKRVPWMKAFDIGKVFPGWTNDDYWPLEICSCKDPRDEEARYYNYCDGYRVTPRTGCNHARMWYGTRAGSAGMETWGSGPYLIHDFVEPLEIGQRYRLSTWIYLVDDGKVDRLRLDSITAHIGAQLMYKRFVPVPTGEMYPGAQLLLDTVRYNEWYEVSSWTFKPLCDLRRLVIGSFRNRSLVHPRTAPKTFLPTTSTTSPSSACPTTPPPSAAPRACATSPTRASWRPTRRGPPGRASTSPATTRLSTPPRGLPSMPTSRCWSPTDR